MSRRRDNRPTDSDGREGVEELEAATVQLEKLRRQHRMRERNRRQYRDEAVTILGRQRKILLKLEAEQELLSQELSALETRQSSKREKSATICLTNIIDRHKAYREQMDEVKMQIEAIESDISSVEKRLREEARDRPSLRQMQDTREKAQSSNAALNNRIQQSTVRLNAVLADNADLRLEIQGQLKERDKFMLQAEKLEKQISQHNKKKNDIMDLVTKAYIERDEAGAKIKAVRDRAARDDRNYNQELKKLQRVLDHQTQLKAFVTTIAAGEEGDTRREIRDGRETRGGPAETLQMYRESMNKLLKAVEDVEQNQVLGEEEVDPEVEDSAELEEKEDKTDSDYAVSLLTNFLQSENDNYTVFSYVSGLNNETSGVTAEIIDLKKEIQEIEHKRNTDQIKSLQTITQLKDRVDAGERAIEELTTEAEKAENILSSIKQFALKRFDSLQCDSESIQAVTSGGGITSSTVTIFLSVMEQRITEILEELPGGVDDSNSTNELSSLGAASPAVVKVPMSILRPSPPQGGAPAEDEFSSPQGHAALILNLRRLETPQDS